MRENEQISTNAKALKINLDKLFHGTIAEIGAGQETARWFFRVGGAANTVAKTISAYDMAVSDAIYGPAERYVSRKRLEAMLDHEYSLLLERLKAKRGETNSFFAFANTIAARSYSRQEEGHGWIGIRFQARPHGEPNELIVHVRLLDDKSTHEQEALGIIGVNLIYAAFYLHDSFQKLIGSLLDGLTHRQIEIDMIRFTGPCFSNLDAKLMSLQLVAQGLTDAVMFDANGEAVPPGEFLYGKDALVLRGSFRPVTNTVMEMLESGAAQFAKKAKEKTAIFMEMSLHNPDGDIGIDAADFIARAMLLQKLGKAVLITNLPHFYSVAVYLSHFKTERIGMILGVPALMQVFEEKYYMNLEGGVLEAFGRLFKFGVELLVYPALDQKGEILSLENVDIPPQLDHLYRYLLDCGLIAPLHTFNKAKLSIYPNQVLEMIQNGDARWLQHVPDDAAQMIINQNLFGYRSR